MLRCVNPTRRPRIIPPALVGGRAVVGRHAVGCPGTRVFRVWGDASGAWGRSWTRVDPRTIPNCRNVAGSPRVKRLSTDGRDDLLLLKVDPPLLGQKFGLGSRDVDMVLVATRHRGSSLFPLNERPIYVHVARPLVEHPELRDHLRPDEFESIAWAELYARTRA